MMDIIERYFPNLPAEQISKLLLYFQLITEWNTKINLISRKDIGNFIYRHIIPCLCINRIITFEKGNFVIDVGTGGGLPGIPLAITNPDVRFQLVDSVGKKIFAVNDMLFQLELNNVSTQNVRVEQINEKFDYIVARAVTDLPDFLKNVKHLRKKTTHILYLKGGDFLNELKNISRYYIHNIREMLDDATLGDKVILEIF